MIETTRHLIRFFLLWTLAGILLGVAYGSLIGFAGWGMPVIGGTVGAVHGFAIAGSIGLLEIFGTRTRVGRQLEKAPLAFTLLVKGLVYGSIVSAVELSNLGERLIVGSPSDPAVSTAFRPLSITFSFALTFVFIFVLQMSRLVGGRKLWNLIVGRYHRPREEERLFLFVDVVGSTRIAESIGPLAMHRLLNKIFSLAGDPVLAHGGEIHQYVGDQMVVTWTVERSTGAQPISCFFALAGILSSTSEEFLRDFHVSPKIRGALHAGWVVTGEVGESKREIAFHGDVLNVTARLEEAAKTHGHRFLISKQAASYLGRPPGYTYESLGPLDIRGRTEPMEVLSVKEK